MKDFTHQYHLNGFVAPVPILSTGEAKTHRHRLERAEDLIGNLHYKAKVHTVLTSPWELATHPAVLDVVESLDTCALICIGGINHLGSICGDISIHFTADSQCSHHSIIL